MSMSSDVFQEIEPAYSLRHYQREAVMEAWGVLREHSRVLLHAPTGSGKTRMAMSIVSMHMRERGPSLVLWLAPTSELISQAANAFEAAWKHHGDSRAVVIQWWGDGQGFAHSMALERNTMLVAGLQMAVQSAAAVPESLKLLRNKSTLIVFDEAHQSVAPTYRALVEDILDQGTHRCLLLGLSATPGRALTSETKALAEMYGDRKVSVAPGRNPVKFLVSKGYLANARVRIQQHPGSPPPTEGHDGDYADAALQELGALDARNDAIVSLVVDLIAEGHCRILVFTPSVSSAERCAAAMREKGVRYAHAVAGEMRQSSRQHILGTYASSIANNPHPQVIFNCRVLTAGVDLPETSAVVIGKPTRSHVLLQQMIGRALRGPKSGGSAQADIRILADESYEDFGDLAAMFAEWDELWEPCRNSNQGR